MIQHFGHRAPSPYQLALQFLQGYATSDNMWRAIISTKAERVSLRRAASSSSAARMPESMDKFALIGLPVSRTSGTAASVALLGAAPGSHQSSGT